MRAQRLSGEDREKKLAALKEQGWTVEENSERDLIKKDFKFDDFTQVSLRVQGPGGGREGIVSPETRREIGDNLVERPWNRR